MATTRKTVFADQKQKEQLLALSGMFTKIDRVLTGQAVRVNVHDGAGVPAPAWSDGTTITFNGNAIDSLTQAETLVRIFGLNYHELAHVLYTPRMGSAIVDGVLYKGMKQSFNILEDQRIETLLTGRYPSTIPYLVSTFMRYCIQDEQSWESNFVLVHGRRFIPADIRAQFRSRFKHQHLIPQIERIIDRYRLLVFPTDEAEALALVTELHELFRSVQMPNIADPHGHKQTSEQGKGSPQGKRQQQKAADAAADLDDALAKDEEDADAGDQIGQTDDGEDAEGGDESGDGDGGEGAEGEATDDASESGGGSGDQQDDSDADDDADTASGGGNGELTAPDGDPTEGNGADTGTDNHLPGSSTTEDHDGDGYGKDDSDDDDAVWSDDDLRDALDDVVQQAESDDDLTDEITAAQRAIVSGGDVDTELRVKKGVNRPVYPEDVSAARKFASVLDRIRVNVDSGWSHGQASGRLNVGQYIKGAPYDEMWDRWEPGNTDATDIECVIALDNSLSMASRMDKACRAMWTIKRALESLDALTTVLTFSDNTWAVYKKGQPVERGNYRFIAHDNGTNPNRAVSEALRVLDASKRHTRIFIVITDGDWLHDRVYSDTNNMSSNQMIQEMNKRGITTALAYIGNSSKPSDPHHCKVATGITSPLELTAFANQVVDIAIKETIKHSA